MSERYEVKARLGEGGAGTVYRAWDTQLSRTVAIKRLFNTDGSEGGERQRKELLREASLLSAIQHPNICQVYDFGVDEEGGYVVMEFVNGEDLEEAARRRIEVGEFVLLATQVLEGLSAAHARHILHRDLKPSNIVINWMPNARFEVKILDFGLAKFSLTPTQQTIDQGTRTAKGSIHYMAPEQFEHRPLDGRTDLYSAGCLFYLVLSGRHPFSGPTMVEVMTGHLEHRLAAPLEQLRPDLPPVLVRWVMWLMNRRPEERPPGAVEALAALRQLAESPDEANLVPSTPTAVSPEVLGTVARAPEATASQRMRPPAVEPGASGPPTAAGPPKTVPVFISEGITPAAMAASPALIPTQPVTVNRGVPPARPPTTRAPVRPPTARGPVHAPTARAPVRPPTARAPVRAPTAGAPVTAPHAAAEAPGAVRPVPPARAKRYWVLPAVACGTVVAAVTAWVILDEIKRREALSGDPAAGSPSGMSAPPTEALLVWLDAGSGLMTGEGTRPAAAGDPVGHWNDRSNGLGGNNAAIYHTVTETRNRDDMWPSWRRVSRGGLAGERPVLTFDGKNDRLVIGRGRGGATGASFGGLLRGDEATCLAVARVNHVSDKPGRVLSARMGGQAAAWGITYGRDKAWHTAIRRTDGSANGITIADTSGDFRILICTWNRAARFFRFHVVKPDGVTLGGDTVVRDFPLYRSIDEIRLGAHSQGNADFLDGDIAEILIYNRALADSALAEAESYLLNKYFR